MKQPPCAAIGKYEPRMETNPCMALSELDARARQWLYQESQLWKMCHKFLQQATLHSYPTMLSSRTLAEWSAQTMRAEKVRSSSFKWYCACCTATSLKQHSHPPFGFCCIVGAIIAMLRSFGWEKIGILATDTLFSKDSVNAFKKSWVGDHGTWFGVVAFR